LTLQQSSLAAILLPLLFSCRADFRGRPIFHSPVSEDVLGFFKMALRGPFRVRALECVL